MSLLTFYKIPDLIHLMMIWNLFLAFLPLIFSAFLEASVKKQKKVTAFVFGFLWLLFLPNSPYMVTDFIHISGTKFYLETISSYIPQMYNMDFMPWLKIIHIGIGMYFGLLLGMYSMYIVQKVISQNAGKIKAYLLIIISCILSGYAIYIGRFLRFNSWDIIKPAYLLAQLTKNINWNAFKFSLLFGGYVLVIYTIFYIFFYRSDKE
ncbi:DUF1361 domain-containing protein [Clostridium oryzae]|nr:DUF1361 domain-containing protein [Clostridium oryzae]